ncbi:cathepsin B [Pelomyxa schiedti]|nr:cathepsin B [Pelomyxa schiedti]
MRGIALVFVVSWCLVVRSGLCSPVPPSFPSSFTVSYSLLSPESHSDWWEQEDVVYDAVSQRVSIRIYKGSGGFSVVIDFPSKVAYNIGSMFEDYVCWGLPYNAAFPEPPDFQSYQYVKTEYLNDILCDVFQLHTDVGNNTLWAASAFPNSLVRVDEVQVMTFSDTPVHVIHDIHNYGVGDAFGFGAFSVPEDCTFFYDPALEGTVMSYLTHFLSVPSKPDLELPENILSMLLNDKTLPWTAGPNTFSGRIIEQVTASLNSFTVPETTHNVVQTQANEIPLSFDARDQWSYCPWTVRDQGSCDSCWAHGLVEVSEARKCIETNGEFSKRLSVQFPVSCDFDDWGCSGGSLDRGWLFMVSKGTVLDECLPYENQTMNGASGICPSTCQDGSPFSYFKSSSAYTIAPGETSIQDEILAYGPIATIYNVYLDQVFYKSGVYVHKYGPLLGSHCVMIVGWGIDQESSLPYWTVVNSWGTDFGEQGLFRILRGSNECGIESVLFANHMLS